MILAAEPRVTTRCAESGSPHSCEPLARPLPSLAQLLLAVPRRGARAQRVDQSMGGRGDLVDGAIEGGLVGARRSRHPAQLADELEGCRADLLVARRRLEVG